MTRSRYFIITGQYVDVHGDTYPVRVRLKELGGRFQGQSKAWRLAHEPQILEALIGMGFLPHTGESDDHRIEISDDGLPTDPQLTVGELCERIDRVLRSGLPARFWLVGELSHVQLSRGNAWLEIADTPEVNGSTQTRRASVQAVIFAETLQRLEAKLSKLTGERLPLESGLRVRVAGRASFWQEGARISVVIEEVDLNFTSGQLALNREKILAELRRKRLLDKNRGMPWVPLPLRVALVTANESRARNDFLHELGQMGFPFQVTLFDCRMQGESTSQDVVRALSWIAERCNSKASIQDVAFDVVVITRGGGSRMDLRWFDDLPIALAIAHCPVPVLTAIGHFDDQSIADQVSAVSEKTPTAAAQHLGAMCGGTLQQLSMRMHQMASKARSRLMREDEYLSRNLQKAISAVRMRLSREQQRLDSAERLLAFARRQIAGVLERGYSLAWDRDRTRPLPTADLILLKPSEIMLEMRVPGREGSFWVPVCPNWVDLCDESMALPASSIERKGS